MRVHPLFGSGIAGKSLVVTAQRRLNCYFENRSDKDRTPIACYGTPGMKFAFSVGSLAQPVRGMAAGIYIWYVIGNKFLQTRFDGSALFQATNTLASSAGYVSFSQNPTQVMLVDGVAGYIYVPSTGVLTTITDTNFLALASAPTTVTNCQGYFVVGIPGTQQFNVSNFYDGTTWQALAFANATGYPDFLIAVDNLIGNLILFCSTHLEFWQNIGGTPQPFAPIQSATTEWGLAAVAGRVHANNCLYFLAASPQGGYSICEISGYQVNVISSPDLDYILGTYATVADCTALAYRADQHPMVQFNFNTAGASWEFDCLTRLWAQKQTAVPTNTASLRHIGNYSVLAGGKLYICDYATNNIYVPDPNTFTDNGQIIKRELITKHQQEDFNVFSIDEMFCDFETGVGLGGSPVQGSNPQVQITCSKDDGRTYLTPQLFGLGAQGLYTTRVETRRWGSSRRFTWKLSMTDPVKWALTSVAQSDRIRPQ